MSIINLKNVDIYQDSFLILEDVSFDLKAGEFCYLTGSTGSGKSSLLKTLYAELPLKKGEAQIAGYDIFELNNKQIPFLRRKIGIVFQDFELLMDRNIKQNLEFVLKATGNQKKPIIEEKINSVLEKVNMLHHIEKMPHELSGGEQQKICIARSLINNPQLILADEPTGNLDPKTTEEIMSLLIKISEKGTTILMATHEHNIIEKFPAKILECHKGRLKIFN